ncbi:cobalamin biosynthesis protein CobG, partial [Streptomyces sp. MBT57]|nr:cobalamin biosynthesis protein CobG [Streptomyces sp. MBT57]
AAERFGDGELHLTSRGNVQLRGLGTECGGELADLLTAAGLLPSAAHERARNIVASPLAGLDGSPSLGPWLAELDALVCGSAAAATLSGRFLFALDDGRGDVDGLGADVTLIAEGRSESALLRIGAADEV